MPDLISSGGSLAARLSDVTSSLAPKTRRELARLQHHAIVRNAEVDLDAALAAKKTRHVNYVAETAVLSHHGLNRMISTVAGADPIAADDYGALGRIAFASSADILANLGMKFAREDS